MPKRLKITVVCFRIMAWLVIIAGVVTVMTFIPGHQPVSQRHYGGIVGALHVSKKYQPLAMGVGLGLWGLALEFVARGLIAKRYWAWIVALVVSLCLVVNGFLGRFAALIPGALCLWGLADPETVAAFRPRIATEESSEVSAGPSKGEG